MLNWNGKAGKTYRVEFKDDLGDATWQPVVGTVLENTLEVGTHVGRQFFRILEEP